MRLCFVFEGEDLDSITLDNAKVVRHHDPLWVGEDYTVPRIGEHIETVDGILHKVVAVHYIKKMTIVLVILAK